MPVEGEQDSKHRKKLKKLERETRLLISPSRAKGGRSRREKLPGRTRLPFDRSSQTVPLKDLNLPRDNRLNPFERQQTNSSQQVSNACIRTAQDVPVASKII